MFSNKPEAKDFFSEYINDVDVLDERCYKNNADNEINHIDHCTCGIVELDEEDGQPILFYNNKNQIFLLEQGAQVFAPAYELKAQTTNLNLLNSLIHGGKTLNNEQKIRYIELGKICEKYS